MKAHTNVSIDESLLKAARENGLQLSRILEDAVRSRLAEEAEVRWREENRDRIRNYAATVGEHGVLSDEFRDF